MCLCVCVRQKQLIYLLTSIFSFDITQTAMKQKLVGEGLQGKDGAASAGCL